VAPKYSRETRLAAVGALCEHRLQNGGVMHGDITTVAKSVGVNPQALRRWAIEAQSS
jgi:transposase-like protein